MSTMSVMELDRKMMPLLLVTAIFVMWDATATGTVIIIISS